METDLEQVVVYLPAQVLNEARKKMIERKLLEFAVIEAYKGDEISLMEGAHMLSFTYQEMADFLIKNSLPTMKDKTEDEWAYSRNVRKGLSEKISKKLVQQQG